MGSWIYDLGWSALLALRQGPKEALGARKNGFLYMKVLPGCEPRLLANSIVSELPGKAPGVVRLVLVSDTHERHAGLVLPPCDAVLHSGDVMACGGFATRGHAEKTLRDFGAWLRSCPVTSKKRFVIAGNHDFWLEEFGPEKARELLGEGVEYLEFSTGSFEADVGAPGSPEIRQVKVYGAPLSAGKSFNRAFQQPEALKRLENVAHVEIVLTHGPLSSSMWTHEELAKGLVALDPMLHVCGHVHGLYGQARATSRYIPGTAGMSINASMMKSFGKLVGQRVRNLPVVCDLQLPSAANAVAPYAAAH